MTQMKGQVYSLIQATYQGEVLIRPNPSLNCGPFELCMPNEKYWFSTHGYTIANSGQSRFSGLQNGNRPIIPDHQINSLTTTSWLNIKSY